MSPLTGPLDGRRERLSPPHRSSRKKTKGGRDVRGTRDRPTAPRDRPRRGRAAPVPGSARTRFPRTTAVSGGAKSHPNRPRPCHPPLFFPWSDVTVSREQRWFGELARFRLAKEPSVPLLLSVRLADEALRPSVVGVGDYRPAS
jgi:hypothetical protein